MGDLFDADALPGKVRENVRQKNEILKNVYGRDGLDATPIIEAYMAFGERLAPFVTDTSVYLNDMIDAGKDVLFEGSQGTLLDIDHGTYPFVTSSNTTAGGACTGAGIGPTRISEVVGVVKAYTTRVGNGSISHRTDRRYGRSDSGNRTRVRGDHGPAEAVRLAWMP